jgi:hypothetical protein
MKSASKLIAQGTVGAYQQIGTALANQTSYTDTTALAGQNYSYVVSAYNAAGTTASSPTYNSQGGQSTANLTLSPGWNLLTLPLEPIDQNTGVPINYTAETFGRLIGATTIVQWPSGSQQYQSHIVGFPINDFPLAKGMGFFAFMNVPNLVSLIGNPLAQTTPAVAPGWNLLGWVDNVAATAESFGQAITGADLIAKFDAINQKWLSHVMNFPLNNFPVNQGDGIFIHKL